MSIARQGGGLAPAGAFQKQKFRKYLLDAETTFPASPNVSGQAESRRAYAELLTAHEGSEWWDDYLELSRRGWDWRKAVYIAWSAAPFVGRDPPTKGRLAVEVLGLASERVFSTWEKKHPEIQAEIAYMQAAPLLRHRRDIFDALATSASDPDPRNHPDRKLAFEMMGDYKQKSQAEISGPGGGELPVLVIAPGLLEQLKQ